MLIRSFSFRFSAVLLLAMECDVSGLSEEGISAGLGSLLGLGLLLGLPPVEGLFLKMGLLSFPEFTDKLGLVPRLGLGPLTGVLFLLGVGLSSG